MPENIPPKTISWSKVILTVLVIVLVSGLISGVLFWYFLVRQPIESTPITTNVATSSSKTASASAKKDETAGWKILITKTRDSGKTISFSFKYPSNFKVEESTYVTNDPNWNNTSGLTTFGKIEAYARIASEIGNPSQIPEESFLGGKSAFRSSDLANNGSVIYFVPAVATKEGNQVPFAFFCYVQLLPKESGSLSDSELSNFEKTCDFMASTFKFL
jgi:hypothetical protein